VEGDFLVTLDNNVFTATFDGQSGAIRTLYAKPEARNLIDNTQSAAFIIEREQNVFSSEFDNFRSAFDQSNNSLDFCWICTGYIVRSTITLNDDGLHFVCQVENRGDSPVCSIEYPLLSGIREFGQGEHVIVHSFATGLEVDDPLVYFKKEDQGFRYMPYPECFSGSSMQFMGYGLHGGAGLYFAADDTEAYHKWFNFYRRGDALCASQIAGYEDIGPGKGIEAAWNFTVKYISETRWEAFGDEYKKWAKKQQWAEDSEKRQRCWLEDDIGAATFGIGAQHDRTRWIKRYREDIGSPVFHVLGPDWTNEPQTFGKGVPGGYPDWLPTRFNKENIEAIRAQDDKFAPFEFDFLVNPNMSESEQIKETLQVWPEKPKSIDKYIFTMLCPTEEYTRDLHVKRDLQVHKESGCDAFYYDISANNILKTCMSEKHKHPVGGGKELTEAFKRIYRETRNAAENNSDKTIPLGTEMINETLIGELDYYQARANAQPGSALETWFFRPLVRKNKARLIPLFTYVYGSLAPLRLDGWGKLTRETGDLIYNTIAKTYLWGGIFEINLEYSEHECIDGESAPPEEHYCFFKPEGFAYDENIAKFIGRCAGLRLSKLGEPMRKGDMIQTEAPGCRKILRTYYMYNHGINSGEQNDRGIIALDAVMAQGYLYNNGYTLYVINTSLFSEEATIVLPPQLCGSTVKLYRNGAASALSASCPADTASATEPEKAPSVQSALHLTLAPLEIIVLQ